MILFEYTINATEILCLNHFKQVTLYLEKGPSVTIHFELSEGIKSTEKSCKMMWFWIEYLSA